MPPDDRDDEEGAAGPTYVTGLLRAEGAKYEWIGAPASLIATASGSAALGADNEAQANSIRGLDSIFQAMSDRDLFVMLEDEQKIGPQIGVTGVHESTIRAVGAFEQQRRSNERKDERRRESHKRDDRKWIIGMIAVSVLAILGWAVALLK